MKKIYTCFLLSLVSCLFAQNTFHNIQIGTPGKINDIQTDQNGNVFVATDDGIWLLDYFTFNLTHMNVSSGLPASKVYDLSKDKNGSIYAATAGKSLATYGAVQGKWNALTLNLSQSFSYFSHVYHSGTGEVFYGTDNGIILRQSAGSTSPIEIVAYQNAMNLGTITSISETTNGVLAILSTNGILLDIQGFVLPITSASALPDDSVIAGIMHNDVSYDGTIQGLYIADFSLGAPPSVQTLTVINSSIPSNRIQALAAFGDSLYVGTDKGLGIYDLNTKMWYTYNKTNSNLPSNNINSLSTDNSGRLWISSGDGNLSTFSLGIGLREKDIAAGTILKSNVASHQIELISSETIGSYKIFDYSGRLCLAGNFSGGDINISSLPTGSYIFQSQSEKSGIAVEKFTKL